MDNSTPPRNWEFGQSLKRSITILPKVKHHRKTQNQYPGFAKCTHPSIHPPLPTCLNMVSLTSILTSVLILAPLPLCSSLSQPSAPCLQPPGPQVHKKWTLYLTTTESKLFVLILMFCAPSELLLKTFWNFEAGWRGMLLTALVGLEKMVLFSTSKLAANLRKQDKFPSRLNQISSQNSKVII